MRQGAGLAAVVLLIGAAGVAGAQAGHAATPPPPAPAARPRVGYAADPAPPVVSEPVRTASPVYFYSPGVYIVSGAPYLVLSDGSVLVDFGNGYERVLRQCAQSNSNGVQVNQAGRDALGRILDPPGIAALKSGSRGQATGAMPARNAISCYRSDAQGRVEMVTVGPARE